MALSERKLNGSRAFGVTVIRMLGHHMADARARLRARLATCARTQRVIFALWHGELLPLLWHHRGQGVCVVISEHKDGEIIARIATRLGYATVRGSTTPGGGARAHRAHPRDRVRVMTRR